MKAFINRIRDNAGRWIFIMLSALIYIAFIWLAGKAYMQLFRGEVDATLFRAYITAIALSVALASTTFSYSRISEKDRDSLKQIGEFFFFGAMSLISGLTLVWLLGQALGSFGNRINIFVAIVIVTVSSLNFIFLLFAADSIHSGIHNLQKILFSELRKEL